MHVLKIEAEGAITSFRYPHFMQQVHPSFEMPPPATIYGHIASALGDYFDPDGVQFAYHFTFSGKATDLEHVMLLSAATGKLKGSGEPKVLEGNINPFKREWLFQPRLTLYINRPDWLPHFRSPRYTVVLGRSQDLFTYTSVKEMSLVKAEHVYLANTLLPYRTDWLTARGYTVLMPRFVDPNNKRHPTFARYTVLRGYADSQKDFFWVGSAQSQTYWVDPDTPARNHTQRGLIFHPFA